MVILSVLKLRQALRILISRSCCCRASTNRRSFYVHKSMQVAMNFSGSETKRITTFSSMAAIVCSCSACRVAVSRSEAQSDTPPLPTHVQLLARGLRACVLSHNRFRQVLLVGALNLVDLLRSGSYVFIVHMHARVQRDLCRVHRHEWVVGE